MLQIRLFLIGMTLAMSASAQAATYTMRTSAQDVKKAEPSIPEQITGIYGSYTYLSYGGLDAWVQSFLQTYPEMPAYSVRYDHQYYVLMNDSNHKAMFVNHVESNFGAALRPSGGVPEGQECIVNQSPTTFYWYWYGRVVAANIPCNSQ